MQALKVVEEEAQHVRGITEEEARYPWALLPVLVEQEDAPSLPRRMLARRNDRHQAVCHAVPRMIPSDARIVAVAGAIVSV